MGLVVKSSPENEPKRAGLCRDCRYKRLIHSERGSTFYLCNRSTIDSSFPKYPRLPVIQCSGYEALSEGLEGEQGPDPAPSRLLHRLTQTQQLSTASRRMPKRPR
jgi:hypothetical protein